MPELEQVALRQLEALLEAQTRVRRAAEGRLRECRRQLERVAEALCAEAVDALRRQGPQGLAALDEAQVGDLVIAETRRRLNRLDAAEMAGRSVADLLAEAQEEVERLRAEVLRLRKEMAAVEERARQAETKALVLAGMNDGARPAGAAAPPQTPEAEGEARGPGQAAAGPVAVEEWDLTLAVAEEQLPGWIGDWLSAQSRERDLALLRILGATGEARRGRAAALFARAIGVDPSAGSVGRAFRRLNKVGVVEIIEAQVGVRGQAHFLRLSRQGEDAYRLLFGQDPAAAQTTELLNRHKSPEHAMLILATADVLEEAGWQVDRFPAPVGVEAHGVYEPDLAGLDPEGQVAFVECERRTAKKAAEREEKWQRYYAASGGRLFVAVPDQEALEAIRSEVVFWLGRRPFRLQIMVVDEARPAKPWAYVREQGRHG